MVKGTNSAQFGRVGTRIRDIYGQKAAVVLALCNRYKQQAERALKSKQGTGQGDGYYWTNQTSMAVKAVRGFVVKEEGSVGWGLMHTMEYGKYLELARNRKHAALEPTVRELAPDFFGDLREIYGK